MTVAEWLNTTFAALDGNVFRAMHGIANGFLTFVARVYSVIGDKGIIFILAAIVLMCFAKTRRIGVCMLGAVGLGAIITNLTLKVLIARPRPYVTSEEFASFWHAVGSYGENDLSFPSGHMTAITAAATAFFLTGNKKYSWVGYVCALFMGFCRIYLIAHYFTDVVCGAIVGLIAGTVAFFITKGIFALLKKYETAKFCKFALYDDVDVLFRKKKGEAGDNEKQE